MCSKYRPRVLTLIVFLVVAAMLVLANLSFDECVLNGFVHKSYGWPFIWHRYVYQSFVMKTIGWYWSAPRLAGNIAVWLLVSLASASVCDWLLRRYRPRLRWSLRTLLAAVGLADVVCGWFAAAWERAKVQDELIVALPTGMGSLMAPPRGFVVERWGPKWLDLIGADCFRRCIVFGEPRGVTGTFHAADSEDERLMKLMARLPDLRSLILDVDHLSPGMAEAINGMRQLRSLRLTRFYENDDNDSPRAHLPPIGKLARLERLVLGNMVIDKESVAGLTNLKSLSFLSWSPADGPEAWHKCLSVAGELTQLERLSMHYMEIHCDSLDYLANLKNLKTLSLECHVKSSDKPVLSHLLPLSRLEALDLTDSAVKDSDLHDLSAFPRLKALALRRTLVTVAGLAELASIEGLEELALEGNWSSTAQNYFSTEAVRSLLAIKGLRKLHFDDSCPGKTTLTRVTLDDGDEIIVPEELAQSLHLALKKLREGHPGIVIDGNVNAIAMSFHEDDTIRFSNDTSPIRPAEWLPTSGHSWLTPSEQADFAARGGWASFEGAGVTKGDERILTVKF